MASGSLNIEKDVIELHTSVNPGHGCVFRAKRKRAPSEKKPESATVLDAGAFHTSFQRDSAHLTLSSPSHLALPRVCYRLDQPQDGCDSGHPLPPAQQSSNGSEDYRNPCDLAGDTKNPEDAQAQTHPGAIYSTDASLTSATKLQLASCTVISVEAEMDCLAVSDSPASSPESTSGSSVRDSVSPERSPSPPPSPPTTTTISSIIPSRKRPHDGALEAGSPSKKRRMEGAIFPESHSLTRHVQPPPESTDPEQPNLLDVMSRHKLPTTPPCFPIYQSRHESAMELVFVHETGYPDVDGASETSEESIEDDDGEGFLGPDAGKRGTPQSRALPIGGDQPTLEKFLDLSHTLEGPYRTDFPIIPSQFVWDASSGAVVEPADLVQLARRNPPYAQFDSVTHPLNSRICLTDYRSNAPLITLGEFKELLDSLPVSVDDGHVNVPAPFHMSGPRFPSSFPFWQCALEDETFVFADKEEAVQASSLWIEAVQNVREDMQAYLEMNGEMLVYAGCDLNTDPLITTRSGRPSIRHPRLLNRLVNGLYSWTPWRVPLNPTLIDSSTRAHASLDSPATAAFTIDLEPIERSIPELFLVTPDSDHDMGFNKGSISAAEAMKDSQALHPWRCRNSSTI